mgnify:CR=1 FL=1
MHMSLIKNFQKYGNNLTELEIECFNKLLTFRDLDDFFFSRNIKCIYNDYF